MDRLAGRFLSGYAGMSDDEIFVLVVCGVLVLAGLHQTRVSSYPRQYTERHPGIGLMRLAVAASLIWTALVIHYYGDPSIKGIYVTFYIVMAYAAVKVFGQVGAQMFGVRLGGDVYERRNVAGAQFIAGFTLATGIVFGGSLWGEADPLSDAEGGWWIPVGFFLLGWGTLVVATALYIWREPGRFRQQLCQERDSALAWSVAIYVVSASTLILEGVAGDFWGWRHGILDTGTIALMLVGHEVLLFMGRSAPRTAALRVVERAVYIGLAVVAWGLNRMIDQLYMGG